MPQLNLYLNDKTLESVRAKTDAHFELYQGKGVEIINLAK